MRKIVVSILGQAPGLQVVGTARDGVDALEKIQELKPDVVTLDIEMPRMDGITALREIMKRFPLPVVMLSSLTQAGAETTFKCLELGAVDFVAKPSGAISLDIAVVADEIIAKVRAAARSKPAHRQPVTNVVPIQAASAPTVGRRKITTIMIGSSTGGPRALQALIPALPKDLGVPVVVVQHMPPSFTASLADRLNQSSNLEVREARAGDVLRPGEVLIAPGGYHLEFNGMGQCTLTENDPVNSVRPSVDVTLHSLLHSRGPRMLGVLLTGMGSDGAVAMKALRDAGGMTIVEAESTCVVYGMPRAAVELGAVDRILPLHAIPQAIVDAVVQTSSARIA
jgi:two-component system chemotaxis response regulator CheB